MEDPDTPPPLSIKLVNLYNSTQEQEYLDNAITESRNELAAIPHNDPDRANDIRNLSSMLASRYELTGSLEDLHEAVTKAEEASTLATLRDEPGRETYLSVLGAALMNRYKRLGESDDLEKSVMLSEEAVAATPSDDPDRAEYLSTLALALLTRFTLTGILDDLQQAVLKGQEAVALTPLDHPDRPIYLDTLAISLKTMFDRTGEMENLEKAISLGQEAMETTPPEKFSGSNHSGNLVNALLARYDRVGAIDDLKRAITICQEIVDVTEPGQPERPWHLHNLANALHARYERMGDIDDLHQMIILGQEVVSATLFDNHYRPMYLDDLACSFSTRHERTGAIEDLQQAITIGQEAVEKTPLGHSERPAYIHNLAASLFCRYECTGEMGDLQQTIAMGHEALDATPLQCPERLIYLNSLVNAISARYSRIGDVGDLELAITLGYEALDTLPSNHPDRPMHLDALTSALLSRHERMGALDDLQQAVDLSTKAVGEIPLDHPDRPLYLTGFVDVFLSQYQRAGAMKDLQQAIDLAQDAVDGTPADHRNRPGYLHALALTLGFRYKHAGVMDDLQQSITYLKEAIETAPLNHPAREMYLDALALDLGTQYKRLEDLELLQQAITIGREVVKAIPQDHFNRAERLSNLGDNIHLRYEKLQSHGDIEECCRCYQEAWYCLTSPPKTRIKAARKAATILAQRSRWEDSILLLESAIQLLPEVSSRSLERDDQQFILSTLNGLAAETTSLALQAGRSGYHAVKLLELSRGIIMGLAIDCRSDISKLKSTNRELFERFDDLRTEIDTPCRRYSRVERKFGEKDQRCASLRRKVAIGKMEATLEEIRKLPGHEGFLLPPPEQDLMTMAKCGPIVVLNTTIFRSDAIIVTSSSIKALRLPKLDFTEASDRLGNMSKLTKSTLRTYSLKNQEMNKLFLWLWDVAVESVLQELQLPAKPDAKTIDLPHIWWVGVGPLSKAPFHAAGDHSPGSVRNTISHAVSSYTPTIKALSYSREKKFSLSNTSNTRLLLITMPETPGYATLPQAEEEVEEIYRLVAGSISTKHLKQPSTPQVLAQLASYNVAHFACHGIALNKNPSDSHLILLKDDGSNTVDKLTVGDVSAANIESAQLAYLSACSTASNPALNLADEIIHIASGFQLAGFSHVLATMWRAHTMTCKEVSTEFYRSLFVGEIDCEDHRKVGMALHVAMKKARETRLQMPLRWAPFVHMGA